MTFDVFEYSNKGGRGYNEDSTGCRYGDGGGIFVVADGLGGHSLGEVASECVVNTIVGGYTALGEDPAAQIRLLIKAANDGVLALQAQRSTVTKSTAAVLAIEGDKAVIANTGDSRVYYFHEGKIAAFTDDHSVAYKKYKSGEITREMLSTDEDQSRLLRTLGSEDRFEPDTHLLPHSIASGDAFLLCSDGLWEYVTDDEMLIDMFKAADSKQWAELMLLRLMERVDGTNDNVSVLTVKII